MLNQVRSVIPAVTHVDNSARVQTVDGSNKSLLELLKTFDKNYKCPILINTSFNVRGEPPVCSPENAYICFLRTDMDYLVLENFIINKKEIKIDDDKTWMKEYELD